MAIGTQSVAGTAVLVEPSLFDLAVGVPLLAGISLVGLVAAAVLLWRFLGDVLEGVRVLTGSADPTAIDERAETYVAVELGDVGLVVDTFTLAQVHDTFGYFFLRSMAAGASDVRFSGGRVRGGAMTLVYRWLAERIYSTRNVRDEGWGQDRCRAHGVDPSTVPARVDGRQLEVTFEDDVRPVQRLQYDGDILQTLLYFASFPWWLGFTLSVAIYPALWLSGQPVDHVVLRWLLPVVLGSASVVLSALILASIYHDTALVGGWDSVLRLDDDAVPRAVRQADDAPDPDRTARVDLATVERGETLRVLGTVESTRDGVRVVEGTVSTRSRAFLLVAAVGNAVHTLLSAAAWAAVAAGAGWLLSMVL